HSRRHGGTIDEAQTERHRTRPAVLPFIVTRFLSPSGIVAVYPRVCVCRRAGCRDCDSGLMPMKHVKLGGFRQPEPRMSSKPIYKVLFVNQGKVYEIYARNV